MTSMPSGFPVAGAAGSPTTTSTAGSDLSATTAGAGFLELLLAALPGGAALSAAAASAAGPTQAPCTDAPRSSGPPLLVTGEHAAADSAGESPESERTPARESELSLVGMREATAATALLGVPLSVAQPTAAPAPTAVSGDEAGAPTSSVRTAPPTPSGGEALPETLPDLTPAVDSSTTMLPGDASSTVTSATPRTAPAAAPHAWTGVIDISGMTPVLGTTASAPPTTTVAPAVPAPAEGPGVAAQVLPEVSRLVQRGDGTHRLTLTLSPEALGDVQVTLTVRGGTVTVEFTAGDDAQRALLESAPELRRLLELTGAAESRISVREAPTGTVATAGSQGGPATGMQGGTDPGDPGTPDRRDPAGPGGDPTGPEGGHREDHHAGTRGGENATDGTPRGTSTTRLPHDPVTSTRPAGLDVTL